MEFLKRPHPLTNFEIKEYYQNQQRLVFFLETMVVFVLETTCQKTIKDGGYVINLNEYAHAGTHWIALFCNSREIVYFLSLGVEHVPEEIK